ncbi:MAG: hypothetical protein ACQERL_11030 [Bacillota bacterium]
MLKNSKIILIVLIILVIIFLNGVVSAQNQDLYFRKQPEKFYFVSDYNSLLIGELNKPDQKNITAYNFKYDYLYLDEGAYIYQKGNNNNNSRINQFGESIFALIKQFLSDNDGEINQGGVDNYAFIVQKGTANQGFLNQNGADNLALIDQFGENNQAYITQDGDGNSASIFQSANDNKYTIIQD